MGQFPNRRTQFKKGRSGNPDGKPSGTLNIRTLIKKVWSEEIIDDNGNEIVLGLLVVKAMFEKAAGGDVAAFKALCERLEGMPKQELDQNIVRYTQMPVIRDDNGNELKFNVGD